MSNTVSVIIPHFNDAENLDCCLRRLMEQSIGPLDIVVVDNNSKMGLAAVERVVAGRARLVLETSPGAAAARNTGIAHSSGDILVFTDSDCRPARDFVAAGVAALDHADFVGGAVKVFVRDPARLSAAEAFDVAFAFKIGRYVATRRHAVTANLFVPRRVFAAVGPFRSGVHEDMDWCLRAGRQGYRIGYAPEAVVEHPARADWRGLKTKWRRMTQEAYGMTMERRLGRARWCGHALLVVLAIGPYAVRAFRCRDLQWIDRFKAVGMLIALRMTRAIWELRLLLQPAS